MKRLFCEVLFAVHSVIIHKVGLEVCRFYAQNENIHVVVLQQGFGRSFGNKATFYGKIRKICQR